MPDMTPPLQATTFSPAANLHPACPYVEGAHDAASGTISYIVADPVTRSAAIIDAVLDFDIRSGRSGTTLADALLARVQALGLHVDWLLETHVHADHLSAMPYLKRRLGAPSGIGGRIGEVQDVFAKVFHAEPGFRTDGSQFDHLFPDEACFAIGALQARVLHTPGHTAACCSFVVGDAVFVGDTLFMPDAGTARCDFPGGSAALLYRSTRRIYALPDATRMFICHDYKPGGREAAWETTVGDQRAANIHLRGDTTEDEFVALRTRRDASLPMPALMLPSVQVNMRAGDMPPAEANGVCYLKIPVDLL